MNIPPGTLFIISAPSGAGKTSLVKALLQSTNDIQVSVSHTTRKPRPGEVDGVHYHFVSQEGFDELRSRGDFLEYAEVFGASYGTSKKGLQEKLEQGVDVILEIDWQGADQVRQVMPNTISVFILPPSRKTLESRLNNRGQDEPETIKKRMAEAVNETSHYSKYDFLIVNDKFEQALAELKSVVVSRRLHISLQKDRLANLINELLA